MNSRILHIFIAVSFCVASCKQNDVKNAASDFCINRVQKDQGTGLLADTTLAIIATLFEYNQMNPNRYQFYSYNVDNQGIHHINAYQYINRLKAFTGEMSFHFDANKKFRFASGEAIAKINLNNFSSLSQKQVGQLYLSVLRKDTFTGIDKDAIISNCLDIEFGYYDLNAGTSNAVQNYAKAWKITPAGKMYPIAYVNDSKSDIIYYFNGVRFLQ